MKISIIAYIALFLCILSISGCSSGAGAEKIAELEEKIGKIEENAESQVQAALEAKEADLLRIAEENSTMKEKIAVLEKEIEDKAVDMSDMAGKLTEKDEVINDQSESFKRLIDRRDEAGSYYNEEDLLWWLVIKFDEGWIRYINVGDETVFKYVVKDSAIYNMAVDYRRRNPHLNQRIKLISRADVEISGSTAKIYVRELLEEINASGSFEEKEYFWVYTAVKNDDVWYLTEMKRDN